MSVFDVTLSLMGIMFKIHCSKLAVWLTLGTYH